ncbi:leucine-rich repeat-containing protein 52-like [Anguilla anguilla]|uniref:leucine-rich repeat-containing protein 52-like n=1 Tax=Anguilla anguilla TaxID=7936 RepID=UPI0015AA97F0|nr:leucine-rich repeat-containing protein 52-like [Anguilla anguilla]
MRFSRGRNAQSLWLVFLRAFVMGAAPTPALTAECPNRCSCDNQLAVQCVGQDLTYFPPDFPLATRQLLLSNNRITELPAVILNYLSDLVFLDCSNNTLSEISESTFGNLRKLAYLDLSFNALAQIDGRTFGPLVSLVMLKLTDNLGLSEIHPDALSENTALQVLDVSRNNLTSLNISSLILLPSLRSIALSGNPWRCDCDTEDLCLWMQIEGSRFQDEGKTVCQGPPDMEGRWLSEVGMQLRTDCHQRLGYQDYIFLTSVGFLIFSAGTVSAWVMGVLMVLYERYNKNANGHEDEDEEEGGVTHGNGDLSKPGVKV